MKKSKKKLNESVTESAVSPLGYIIFIDASSAIGGNRGSYLRMMFPNETPDILKHWFRPLLSSEIYAESEDSLQGINSRFSNNPSLKALFTNLEKLKSSTYSEADKESHENDIELIIKRISIFIKRKLTKEDIKVLESMIKELNSVVEYISQKIDDEIDLMAEPEEDETEKIEEPELEKPKTEIKINERMRNKFRKKIKEIIRTHLFNM